jgi:hypothetical protein
MGGLTSDFAPVRPPGLEPGTRLCGTGDQSHPACSNLTISGMPKWVPPGQSSTGRKMRIWGKCVVAAAALVAAQAGFGVHFASATPSHPGEVLDTCPEALAGGPTGGVEKLTRPPAESVVHPGELINVSLRWEPGIFERPVLHKALDCVTVDGQFAPALSVQERDTVNDGLVELAYTVPAVSAGMRLCDRGFVSGATAEGGFDREKSNDVCFTVQLGVAGSPAPAASPVLAPAPVPTVVTPPPALDTQLRALGEADTAVPPAENVSALPDTAPGLPAPEVTHGAPPGTAPGVAPPTMAPSSPESSTAEVVGESLPRTGVGVRVWLLSGLMLVLAGLSLRQLADGMTRDEGLGRQLAVTHLTSRSERSQHE